MNSSRNEQTTPVRVQESLISLDRSRSEKDITQEDGDTIQVLSDSRINETGGTVNNPPSRRAQQSRSLSRSTTVGINLPESKSKQQQQQQSFAVGRFFSICFVGSIESGTFGSVNDVYIKYSILAGPDWIISSGTDIGITQIARYKINENNQREFVWNQPIAISYRSYNFYGWPQVVFSVYNFDTFGNDQILGYGCVHLPISNRVQAANQKQVVEIYSPQSSSYLRQILSWITGKKPELVDSNLFARGDCRSLLHMVAVGKLEISFNLTSKDVINNGYKS